MALSWHAQYTFSVLQLVSECLRCARLSLQELEWSDVELMFILMSGSESRTPSAPL